MPKPKCIEWTGPCDPYGYAYQYARVRGKFRGYRMSRMIWEAVHGTIPPGLLVMHRCDNPRCVNVTHFRLGTKKDNNDDCLSKGRARRACGEDAGHSKLTVEDVHAIRRDIKAGEQIASIARKNDVSHACISSIARGRTWSWLAAQTT